MIKYFCDGCDTEISQFERTKHSVTVLVTNDRTAATPAPQSYELCDGCLARLVRESSPRRWNRVREVVTSRASPGLSAT